jgi:hypothetical protein
VYKTMSIAKPNEDGLVPKLGKQEDHSEQAWDEKTGNGTTVVQDMTENTVLGEKDLVKEHCSRYPHCVPCFVNLSCI